MSTYNKVKTSGDRHLKIYNKKADKYRLIANNK
ncbi:hypothetical protein PP176A_0142 [Sporanaerobacter sp. PP17-6a]|nr:hypothetical protein PP176A_0142 [Sporanaerobacter sp. PP17-6a]